MNMKSGSGCFNTVIFNDGEIVHRQNKTSTLDCCFALPECLSPADAGDLLTTASVEQQPQQQQQQQENVVDDQVVEESKDKDAFVFPVDFNRAFGLMESDEAGMDQTTTTTTPLKVVSPSKLHNSSPTSVISPSVYDVPTKQQQKQHHEMCRARMNSRAIALTLKSFNSKATRRPISLEGYSVGDQSKLNDSISLEVSNEEAALAAKSLEVGDAAFILRSDCKWTYAIVIDKAVVLDGMVGQSALRFEVGADGSLKTFKEAQWGKYVRVIKTTNSTVLSNDHDLSNYQSDLDEKILNDYDYANHDAGAVYKRSGSTPKPKGILRNKQENALDRCLKSKVFERSTSGGSARYSVQIRSNWIDGAETRSLSDNKADTTIMQTMSHLQLLAKIRHKKDDRKKKGLQYPELAPTSPTPQNTSTKSIICLIESWYVGQLLSKLTQPVFSWQCMDDDKDIVHEEDTVGSLPIECVLRDDGKFHEVHILTEIYNMHQISNPLALAAGKRSN